MIFPLQPDRLLYLHSTPNHSLHQAPLLFTSQTHFSSGVSFLISFFRPCLLENDLVVSFHSALFSGIHACSPSASYPSNLPSYIFVQAPGVPVSQGPFPVHPPALPASLPPLGRDFFQLELLIPQTQRQRGGSQLTHQTNFDNILTTLWNDADPTANLGVNPPVTYDLGGVTPSGAGPDRGPRPSPEMLFEDWARPR